MTNSNEITIKNVNIYKPKLFFYNGDNELENTRISCDIKLDVSREGSPKDFKWIGKDAWVMDAIDKAYKKNRKGNQCSNGYNRLLKSYDGNCLLYQKDGIILNINQHYEPFYLHNGRHVPEGRLFRGVGGDLYTVYLKFGNNGSGYEGYSITLEEIDLISSCNKSYMETTRITDINFQPDLPLKYEVSNA